MATSRRFILEVLVDTVTVSEFPKRESISMRDVRLSVSLSEFPVVHIKPSPLIPQTPSLGDSILFGGAGKLCEFSLSKSDLVAATFSLLLLKEIPSINDHLILCMTAPVSFRELLLSLPSCSPQPFVKRQFLFLDGRGSVDIFIRVSAVQPEVVAKTSRRNLSMHATSRTRPATAVQRSTEIAEPPKIPLEPLLSPKQPKSPRMSYGGLRKRAPIIY